MSRTRKGSKGPGWELWTNKLDKQEQRADYREEDGEDDWPDETCPGCPQCRCVKCGGWVGARFVEPREDMKFVCIDCGHQEIPD